MEAKELMIGDWVYSTFCDKPCKVIGIEQYESEYVNVKVTNVTGAKDINSLYFIPLTAEILEKNGWKDWFEHSTIARSVSVLVEDNTSLCIQEIKGQDSMFVQISHCGAGTFEFRKHLKYVHELQHALRECGIDKEIVL